MYLAGRIRKNSLFVGSARGGRTAAILASLTSTCRRHDVDPQLYLTQLLTNLPTTRMNELSAWLPDRMRPAKYTVDGGAQGMREVFRRVSLPPMQRA